MTPPPASSRHWGGVADFLDGFTVRTGISTAATSRHPALPIRVSTSDHGQPFENPLQRLRETSGRLGSYRGDLPSPTRAQGRQGAR